MITGDVGLEMDNGGCQNTLEMSRRASLPAKIHYTISTNTVMAQTLDLPTADVASGTEVTEDAFFCDLCMHGMLIPTETSDAGFCKCPRCGRHENPSSPAIPKYHNGWSLDVVGFDVIGWSQDSDGNGALRIIQDEESGEFRIKEFATAEFGTKTMHGPFEYRSDAYGYAHKLREKHPGEIDLKAIIDSC